MSLLQEIYSGGLGREMFKDLIEMYPHQVTKELIFKSLLEDRFLEKSGTKNEGDDESRIVCKNILNMIYVYNLDCFIGLVENIVFEFESVGGIPEWLDSLIDFDGRDTEQVLLGVILKNLKKVAVSCRDKKLFFCVGNLFLEKRGVKNGWGVERNGWGAERNVEGECGGCVDRECDGSGESFGTTFGKSGYVVVSYTDSKFVSFQILHVVDTFEEADSLARSYLSEEELVIIKRNRHVSINCLKMYGTLRFSNVYGVVKIE